MKITYLVKHNIDYSIELEKARQIAEWAVVNKFKTSSKLVKHIGLKSTIANQILKKYGKSITAKEVSNIKLTIPSNNETDIRIKNNQIYVPCLNKLTITPWFDLTKIIKINQIEVDNKNYYITCEISEEPQYLATDFLGIDLNTTEHAVVIASGNKIIKRAKDLFHKKRKYSSLRRKLQKKQQYKTLRKLKNKEKRVIKDKINKLTREVVDLAKKTGKGIRLENLTNIRENTNKIYKGKKIRYSTNNWNFSQFRHMIEYKAKICGVPIEAINPAYTSKTCSICGCLGQRSKKNFKCDSCGHVDHADANAAFNIAIAMKHIANTSKVPCIKGMCAPEEATSIDGIDDLKQRTL